MNRRQVGAEYESKAARYLTDQGYQILVRNFYSRAGEIDLIAEKNGCLVFIEVKYRKNAAYGLPEESVSMTKRQRMRKTAAYYMHQNGLRPDRELRFDVIVFEGENIRHHRNAF